MEPIILSDNVIDNKSLRIGVLALQGGFIEHVNMIRSLGAQCQELRSSAQIKQYKPHGLILPGGESTAMAIIASNDPELFPLIKDLVHKEGVSVYGTCAGCIMLSDNVEKQKQGGQTLIGGLDLTISRNYFGRQINSFETVLKLKIGGEDHGEVVDFPGIFIRAPAILSVNNPEIKILGEFQHVKKDKTTETIITGVSYKNMVTTVFHPELTNDNRFHKYFIDIVKRNVK
ncbi:SNO glutamine amidotransferase family protein [Heterostelium album PN500]|uniref:glutaminase n=1 Tax=Heterostelium pallidum (strain ATCC 26659 / Pp 5 / PN500) TaxID=670386 RepID=D3BPW7_HETP5|nr:SNO glutamine amidotransferase family protein [Heterostelium album PN500]EFA76250.1 SNO glutamine amidotransferase family protein [Heterostelium album PN500]|eukprot:XP_020428383.1 SNO glutamine amidotransferase family protein [Heterostelium album PN500]